MVLLARLRNAPRQYYPSRLDSVALDGESPRCKRQSCFTFTCCDSSSNFDDVVIKRMAHVIEIGKDECFAHIGPHSNNILDILSCKP